MPTASREASQRGLVVVVVLVVAILVVIDLLRPDSLILGIWGDLFGPADPVRGFFRRIREQGPGRIFRR